MTDSHVSIDGVVESVTTGLIERAKEQDPSAWQRITAIYGPLVYCWARRRGLPPEDARDVGQEVFYKVHRSLGRFRRDRETDTFRGWLRVITENTIRDHFRAEQKKPQASGGSTARQQLHDVADEPISSDLLSHRDEVNVIYRQIVEMIRGEFSEEYWQCFWKVVAESQTAEEVAQQLGVSRNQVYLAKSRIMKRIRELWGDAIV